MNWQKISELPCVIDVLHRAENEINVLTGKEIVLLIAEVNFTKEDRKAILQETICSYFNVAWKDIAGKTRTRDFINARHTYMYFASRFITYHEAGMDCGGRDHTTVVNAIQKIEGYYKVKDDFIIHLEAIKNLLPKDILK